MATRKMSTNKIGLQQFRKQLNRMYANLLRDADLYFTSESRDNSLGFSGLSVGDGLNVDQKRHYTFLIFKYFISKNLESDCFENVGLDLMGGEPCFLKL